MSIDLPSVHDVHRSTQSAAYRLYGTAKKAISGLAALETVSNTHDRMKKTKEELDQISILKEQNEQLEQKNAQLEQELHALKNLSAVQKNSKPVPQVKTLFPSIRKEMQVRHMRSKMGDACEDEAAEDVADAEEEIVIQ